MIADNPDVQERMTLDVRSTGQGELDRVIKETLRLYPPAFALFARESTREIILRGYPIPPRTTLFVSPYVLHHDSRFFERPETFDPDRDGAVDVERRCAIAADVIAAVSQQVEVEFMRSAGEGVAVRDSPYPESRPDDGITK